MDEFTFQGSLAIRYGLIEAIVLAQIRKWLGSANLELDGQRQDGNVWITRTISQFLAACPFLSIYNVRTALKRLEADKLILIRRQDASGRMRKSVADYTLTDKGRLLVNFPDVE